MRFGKEELLYGGGLSVSWEILSTLQFEDWYDGLPLGTQDSIIAATDVLGEMGPSLGRPLVDSITGSRHSNMKELRVGTIRILFAFDPCRRAVLLIGGDKANRWQK